MESSISETPKKIPESWSNLSDLEQVDALKSRAWGFFALANLLMFFCGVFGVWIVLNQFVKLSMAQQVVYQTLFFHWLGLLAIFLHSRFSGQKFSELYGLKSPLFETLKQIFVRYLKMVLICAGGAFLWGAFLNLFGIKPEVQDVAKIIIESPINLRIYLIFLAAILAPIFEEFVFRGVFLPCLLKRFSFRNSAVILSLIFAMLHGHLQAFLPLFIVSMCLCYAYLRSGSLWVNIGMHALFNGVNLMIMFKFMG